uniref:Uncharacterized protein n=1 Tax=Caenorhabditis tropicalis TaxID=1561998 RepID=A0A1I7UV89_9PELO
MPEEIDRRFPKATEMIADSERRKKKQELHRTLAIFGLRYKKSNLNPKAYREGYLGENVRPVIAQPTVVQDSDECLGHLVFGFWSTFFFLVVIIIMITVFELW